MIIHTNFGEIELYSGDCTSIIMEDKSHMDICIDCKIGSEVFHSIVMEKRGTEREFCIKKMEEYFSKAGVSMYDIGSDESEEAACLMNIRIDNSLDINASVIFSDQDVISYSVLVPIKIQDDMDEVAEFVSSLILEQFERVTKAA